MTLIDTNPDLTSPEQLQIRLEALLEQEDEIRQLRKDEAYACAQFPALQEAAELRRELEAAASFQQDLLPAFPVKSGDLVVHGLWRPSRYLAGDLLRVEPAADGGLVILLCDVMGHGIPAAIGSALLTQSFDHARESSGADAAMILERMNQDLHRAQQRQGTRAWFASAICAHVAPSGTITVASAGHPQSLILSQDPESALTIATSGPLLGIDNASAYQASTHQLPEGGKLILHSDGFETLNRGRSSAQANVQNALGGSSTDAAGLIDQLGCTGPPFWGGPDKPMTCHFCALNGVKNTRRPKRFDWSARRSWGQPQRSNRLHHGATQHIGFNMNRIAHLAVTQSGSFQGLWDQRHLN